MNATPKSGSAPIPAEQQVTPTSEPATLTEIILRLFLWAASAGGALAIDVWSKAASHPIVLHHFKHVEAIDLIPTGLFLLCLGVYRSKLVALGAGLMFGGLLGNGIELLRYGYATDWIVVWQYVTNIADIAAVLGLLCLWANVLLLWRRKKVRQHVSAWLRNVAALTAVCCGAVVAFATGDLRLGEIVFFLVLIEAFLLERVVRSRARYA